MTRCTSSRLPESPARGTGRCWRTVILGGERGGGDVYFAIDVTDPHNPTVLWEYSMLKNRVVYDRSGTRSLTNCATTPNDANCKAANMNTAYLFTDSTTYEKLKVLPVAWSRPAVGRLRIPTAVNVYKLPTSTTVGLSCTRRAYSMGCHRLGRQVLLDVVRKMVITSLGTWHLSVAVSGSSRTTRAS